MDDELKQWLAVRKEAGLKINPNTADVFWEHGEVGEPYGVLSVPEYRQIGRCWFARAPCSDIWVSFYDLPDETLQALRSKPEEYNTPPPEGFDRLAQSILRIVRKFPNEIDEFDECLKELDSMGDDALDEPIKTTWRNRCLCSNGWWKPFIRQLSDHRPTGARAGVGRLPRLRSALSQSQLLHLQDDMP